MSSGQMHHRATMGAERFAVLTFAHDGFVTSLLQSLLREHPGERLHSGIPVDDSVVRAHHIDGVARAGFDEVLHRFGELVCRALWLQRRCLWPGGSELLLSPLAQVNPVLNPQSPIARGWRLKHYCSARR